MTKKMKREQKPTPVGEDVAAEMETRMAYQNLIQSFTADQHELEVRIKEAEHAKSDDTHSHSHDESAEHSSDDTPSEGSGQSSN
jgi:hypothetical protein